MIKFIQIFLLVLIIFGIGLLFTQKLWVPKVTEAILDFKDKDENTSKKIYTLESKIDTTNWEIYSNKDFGFELKYPKDWIIDNSSSGSIYISKSKENQTQGTSLRIITPQDLSTKPEIKANLIEYIDLESNFIVDGLNSIRELKKDDTEGLIEYISFIKDDLYFVITLTWKHPTLDSQFVAENTIQNKKEILEIYNQILYTFKLKELL